MSNITKNKIINSLKSLSMNINDKEVLANFIISAINSESSGGESVLKLPIFNKLEGVVDSSINNPYIDIVFKNNSADGNPIYETKVYVPQGLDGNDGNDGTDGKTPVFDTVQVITLDYTEQAYANVIKNGTDSEGNPKYNITFGIPKGVPGENGSSSGDSSNVSSDSNIGRILLANANNLSTGQTIYNTNIYNFIGQANNPSTTEKFREFDVCMDFYKNIFAITDIAEDGQSATIGSQLSK